MCAQGRHLPGRPPEGRANNDTARIATTKQHHCPGPCHTSPSIRRVVVPWIGLSLMPFPEQKRHKHTATGVGNLVLTWDGVTFE